MHYLNEIITRLLTLFIFDTKKRKEFRFKHIARFNNTFVLIKKNGKKVYNPRVKGLKVRFCGKNSYVEIHEPCEFRDCEIMLSNNCKFVIQETRYYVQGIKMILPMAESTTFMAGKNFLCRGIELLMHGSPFRTVKIGDNCMLSDNITIFPSDDHAIYDENHNVINHDQDITIGNKVWIGMGAIILKGSNVPDNSVIGFRSVYTRHSSKDYIPQREDLGGIFAGFPAKLIRNGISWGIESPYYLIPW